jgi:hypothetical protein
MGRIWFSGVNTMSPSTSSDTKTWCSINFVGSEIRPGVLVETRKRAYFVYWLKDRRKFWPVCFREY